MPLNKVSLHPTPLKSLFQSFLVFAIIAMCFCTAQAEDKKGDEINERRIAARSFDVVPLAEAESKGLIEVKYIPKNSLTANIMVKNKTKENINIGFPKVFAAKHIIPQRIKAVLGKGDHIAAQFDNNNVFDGGFPNNNQQGGNQGNGQTVGGRLDDNNNNVFPNNNIFNIAPEKIKKLTATTVCMNHGRPDPTTRMTYKIVPIEDAAQDLAIIPLLAMLTEKEASNKAIQAAVWHLENGLSWQKLYDLRTGPRILTVGRARMFSRKQLNEARKLVNDSKKSRASASYSR